MENLSHIDAYLLGNLNKAEKIAFEKNMAADPNLAKEVDIQRSLIDGVKSFGQTELKTRFQTAQNTYKAKSSKTEQSEEKGTPDIPLSAKPAPNKRRKLIYLLVGAVAAAFAYFIIANYTDQPLDRSMYADNFEDYNWSGQQRSGEETALDNLKAFYKEKDYATVLAEIQANFSDSKDPSLIIAKGVSQMHLNQHDSAIKSFQEIIDMGRVDFEDHAYWYMALSQLKLDNKPAAKLALEKIVNSKRSAYKEQAADLLKKL